MDREFTDIAMTSMKVTLQSLHENGHYLTPLYTLMCCWCHTDITYRVFYYFKLLSLVPLLITLDILTLDFLPPTKNTIQKIMSLARKLALVTGSTSGIGLGIARSLAAKGSDIVLNGFGTQAEIDALCKDIADKYKVKVHYEGADLSKTSEIEDMMARIAKKSGSEGGGGGGRGLDILVNNAGIQFTSKIDAFPVAKWDAIISLNLSSVFHTTRLALPGMKTKNWGRIVNIASVHGLVASAEKSAYVAAKHGVVGFTKVTALETALTGVTCNAICPGWVLTPLVQKQIDDRAKAGGISQDKAKTDLLKEKQPSQQFVTPQQLGEMAAFLCSDAASEMRGQCLVMDGGWTAQ